ncbi:nuclear transport factor 2 family protein [Streptomyces hainanensis]|uniref:DUF3225 domain-containing protein n=1 Tax=Streptomyces hainanensis TaxID=402648 RepID=A0A4R4TQ08_9ACTN|nr:nuclear transport factor 2 family protein [Streptomyces hainanensis]TDC80267.1 DUF3225 domain-containing protein [Streptomyces hainanensis]
MSETTDRAEIAGLFARLSRVLDEARYGDAHTVYADHVTVRSPTGGRLSGIDEVTDHLRRSRPEGERTLHLHGDVEVAVDGDRGSASATQLVYFYREGRPPHREAGVRVVCAAARTPAGWRFDAADIALVFARPAA